MSPVSKFSADTCPLCGEANACAVAAGRPPETCWCFSTPVSPSALRELPEPARGTVCICARCAAQQGDPRIER